MKIKTYKCLKCGSDEFFMRTKNGAQVNQVGIYCDRCGMWYKWADKWEKNLRYKEGGR